MKKSVCAFFNKFQRVHKQAKENPQIETYETNQSIVICGPYLDTDFFLSC